MIINLLIIPHSRKSGFVIKKKIGFDGNIDAKPPLIIDTAPKDGTMRFAKGDTAEISPKTIEEIGKVNTETHL